MSRDRDRTTLDAESFLSTQPWNASEMPESARRFTLRRRRLHRLLGGLAALFMIAASFRAGQELPPERIGQALDQLLSNELLVRQDYVQPISQSSIALSKPLAADHEECRMVRLSSKSCGECGKRLWPLMKSGESCPYCSEREVVR